MSRPAHKRERSSGHPEKAANADIHNNYAASQYAWQSGGGTIVYAIESFNKFPSDYIPPGSFNPNTPTQFDTRWPKALVHQLKSNTVQIIVQNPDLVNVMTLSDPSVWFPRIEIMSNGASVDYQIYDIMFWVDKMSQVSDEKRGRFAYGNIYNPYVYRDDTAVASNYIFRNYDTTTTFNIPAGGERTFYIQYNSILTDSKFFFPTSTVEPRLRWYTGNNIQTTTSLAAATNPNLIQMTTFLRGYNFSPECYADLVSKYSGRVSLTRSVIYERQTFSFTITSGQETTDSLLTALTGTYAWLWFIVTQTAPVQNQLYSDYIARDGTNGVYWKKLVDITLLDANQNPVNMNKMPVDYLKYEVMGNHFDGALSFEKEIVLLPFSNNCQLQRMTGQDLGSKYMDGNFTFRFTPLSVPTYNVIPANFNIELIVLGARVVTFAQTRDGNVRFVRLPVM